MTFRGDIPPAAGIDTGVAVVGLALRVPGASDAAAFWRLVTTGESALNCTEAPRDGVVRSFGSLAGLADFDADFFGYPPSRADVLDPQQRLLLECCWHALENAGYGAGEQGFSVGAYLASTPCTYRPALSADPAEGLFRLTASDKDYAATRVSNRLGLTGPSVMVQAACSSSLAAVHMAVEALLSGQCDVALAGGVSLTVPQDGYTYTPGMMVSPTGRCAPFDAAADGTVPGNGAAVVVLKPLDAARADGDRILAVIRGSAIGNDGAVKADYLAPSVAGQARVIGEALAVSGVSPDTIGFIETHGTGTTLGDPIEFRALCQAWAPHTDRRGFCALGAVKANIGHLNVAGGVVGLVKAVLALEAGQVPPLANFRSANPEVALDSSPFFVPRSVADWPVAGLRRAAVSSFGLGGTNVHVVLEQAPPPLPVTPAAAGPLALPLSARTPEALAEARRALAAHLRAHPGLDLADVALTLRHGRAAFPVRAAVVAASVAEAAAVLDGGETPGGADSESRLAADWCAGWQVSWPPLQGRRVALPGYAFQRRRHWTHQADEALPAVPKAAAPAADLLDWLRGEVAEVLGRPLDAVGPDAGLDALGLDSLLSVSIANRIRARFPDLRDTALFEFGSLRHLAASLAEQAEIPAATPLQTSEPIAVIGLWCRFPGAPDPDAFWRLLRDGRSGIGPVPADRWDGAAHYDPAREDRSYTRRGGFLDGVDRFDPLLFGIAPREARMMDPQQRLFLETAWATVEDAGYTPDSLQAAGPVGVFAGVMNQPYRLVGMDSTLAGGVVQTGHWGVANRVSFHLGFTGPSLAVDTACSASLTAVHLACQSLRRGECGTALAGGVNLVLHPAQPLELCRMNMLSPTDRCRPFAEGADGMVQGEGVGAVLLKPLSRALADGDHIHGVIRGSAIEAGGRTAGFTVPSGTRQRGVIRAALADAGVDPADIGYVECHGTGTDLGDPVETQALAEALSPTRARVRIASVKSNIGHLESAAGIAGLIKTLLQLRHGELVASLDCDPPNRRIDFAALGLDVVRRAEPWTGPRRAGISSFGAGGSNAHVVVEQAPAAAPSEAVMPTPVVVVLSAATPDQVRQSAARLVEHLARPLDAAGFRDLAYTLAVGRRVHDCTVAVRAADGVELKAALSAFVAAAPHPALVDAPCDPAAQFVGERRRRVPAPTYPFARDRYWLPDAPKPVAASVLEALPSLDAGAAWRVTLDPATAALADHKVGGVPTLAGVAQVALVLEAARQIGLDRPAVRGLVWLRPLTAAEARLVLRRDGAGMAFVLEGPDGPASQGRLEAADDDGRMPVLPAGGETLDSAAIHATLGACGLDYGPVFRAIRSCRLTDGGAEAEIVPPPAVDGFALHPGVLDSALQTAAMLVMRRGGPRLLPFACDRLTVLGDPAAARTAIAVQVGEGRYDLALRDADGRPLAVFRDLVVRADTRVAPVALDGLLFVPDWRPAEGQTADAPALVVHGAGAEEWVRRVAGARPVRLADPAAVDALAAEAAELGGLWFVCGADGGGASDPDVLRLFPLLRRLKALAGTRPLRLGVATVNAHALPAPDSPWPAAVIGLARAAVNECPSWTLAAIDVGDAAELVRVAADAGDPAGREVAWRGGRRMVRGLRPVTLEPAAFPKDAHVLVLGGSGGIGMALADHLVARHRARVTLLSRHAPAGSLGEGVRHVAADALDAASLRGAVAQAVAAFGPVRIAVHSALVMADAALDRMDDVPFRAAFDVKARGCLNLAEALEGQPLDALVLFSSANSFAANAGQANYVAGCAFKDAFGHWLAARGVPVRTINWGFWGEVGRVAQGDYAERLGRQGVLPLSTAEGLAAFEAVLGGAESQVMVLKAEPRALAKLGVAEAEEPLTAAARAYAEVRATAMAGAWAEYEALDRLAAARLGAWWREQGLDRVADVAAHLGTPPRLHRQIAALEDILRRHGTPAEGSVPPDLLPHVALLDRCLEVYREVLTGRLPATEALFPNGSPDLVVPMYRGNRMVDHFNGLTAVLVREAARTLGRPLRVLEFGGGTGATTAAVLPALDGVPVDYVFTDISVGFCRAARARFGEAYPFVRYEALDVTADPLAQGFEAASFDLILGANALHATADIGRSVGNLSRLLAPSGRLMLYEMTRLHDFVTVTFGLLDGWWAATDPRMDHAPLLSAPQWADRLRAAGLVPEGAFSEPGLSDPAAFRHAVIVARRGAEAVAAAEPKAAVPMLRRMAAARQRATAANDDGLAARARAAVVAAVCEGLEIAPEVLRDDRPFSDYGTDSLLSVVVVKALNASLGIDLRPTALFTHPTVADLTAHLVERHAATLGEEVPESLPEPVPAAPARPSEESIAIIGLSGRFPGAADLDVFWRMLAEGRHGLAPVTRWDHRDMAAGCPDGGFLDGIEMFDPGFFGLSPAEATAMDPQQRLLLEETWRAFEDAGHAGDLKGRPCGVFVGTVAGDYQGVLGPDTSPAHAFMGNAASLTAARVAYHLGLTGPALSVDTACSSSLVALHLACESLRRGECTMAVAAGVAVMTTPDFYRAAISAGMLSPTGRCRALDAAADGFVPGEAVVAVVLKPLAQALADGDSVHGVIVASGVNQDGASNGLTAPNAAAQADLIRTVHHRHGIDPAGIGYLELHGTGTKLGDPIEIEGLCEAFSGVSPGACRIGSVKSNIGHSLPAAGLAGLAKVVLMLRHGVVPPSLHIDALNPHLPLDNAPFRPVVAAEPWPRGGTPRRAALNAFGFGGTNAHVVIEDAPVRPAPTPRAGAWPVVVSARSAGALADTLRHLADHLPDAPVADIAYSLAVGRGQFPYRAAVMAEDVEGLRAALRAAAEKPVVAVAAHGAVHDQMPWPEVVEAWLSGATVPWATLLTGRRVSLPTYRFERRRCWPASEAPPSAAPTASLFDSVVVTLDARRPA